jgi:arginyl-tRNA synthetase
VRAQLEQFLRLALTELSSRKGHGDFAAVAPQVERTRDARHGDFTSNVALTAAKALGISPRELAADIVRALPSDELIEAVVIAGPGFINFTLKRRAYQQALSAILHAGVQYGCSKRGAGKRILLEYLSANPTGPLHVGHGRHAAYGASLANVLRATGHDIDEEYYVNDAGRQMDILAASVWLRYAQKCGADLPFPPNAYQGDYVRDIAESIWHSDGTAFAVDAAAILAQADAAGEDSEARLDAMIAAIRRAIGPAAFEKFHAAGLDSVLADIKNDLEEFGVLPQRWYSERSLTESGAVRHALDLLKERGMLYQRDGATWFRATDYGDEKDRVVVRENGATTYFASDIAYHLEKRERGYGHLLDVLGADHHGYVARVRAGLEALGQPGDCLEVRLVQFVVLYRGKTKAQMSTRSGEYILAKAQSNDNPVYYVQYAHARVASMLRRMNEEGMRQLPTDEAELELLTTDDEHGLMVTLSRYPEIVELAAESRAPQHIVHFLRELAGQFHSYYNAHRVLVEEPQLRAARVALAQAVQQTIRNGLGLLGVSAPEAM